LYFEFYEKNGKKKAKLKVKRYFAQLAVWVFVVTIVNFVNLVESYITGIPETDFRISRKIW
jgi:hypothetical protein